MPVEGLLTHQLAVQSAAPYVSNLSMHQGIPLAEAVTPFSNVICVQCIVQPVPVVVMMLLYPLNHVMVKLCIAVSVINPNVVAT